MSDSNTVYEDELPTGHGPLGTIDDEVLIGYYRDICDVDYRNHCNNKVEFYFGPTKRFGSWSMLCGDCTNNRKTILSRIGEKCPEIKDMPIPHN
jgi:hypothetical protein